MEQPRQPRGRPSGGEWAEKAFQESQLSLDLDAPDWSERSQRIASLRSDIDQMFLTQPVDTAAIEQKVSEVGRIIDAELYDRIGTPPQRDPEQGKVELAAYEEQTQVVQTLMAHWVVEHPGSKNYSPELLAAFDKQAELRRAYRKADEPVDLGDWNERQNEALLDILGDIRSMGESVDAPLECHAWSQPVAVRSLKEAMAFYPTDWIEASNQHRPIVAYKRKQRAHYCNKRVVKKTKRVSLGQGEWTYGNYADSVQAAARAEEIRQRGKIRMYVKGADGRSRFKEVKIIKVDNPPGSTDIHITYDNGSTSQVVDHILASEIVIDGEPASSIHEMAHRMGHANPRLAMTEEAFLRRRSTMPIPDMTASQVSSIYQEISLSGNFVHRYVGRFYGREEDGSLATETMSVGMESIFCGNFGTLVGGERYNADEDHRAFVLGSLASL